MLQYWWGEVFIVYLLVKDFYQDIFGLLAKHSICWVAVFIEVVFFFSFFFFFFFNPLWKIDELHGVLMTPVCGENGVGERLSMPSLQSPQPQSSPFLTEGYLFSSLFVHSALVCHHCQVPPSFICILPNLVQGSSPLFILTPHHPQLPFLLSFLIPVISS